MQYAFQNDYSVGAHPKVLEAIYSTNGKVYPGYGQDECCQLAAGRLLEQIGCPDGKIYFLTGGTQTNLTAISALLRPHEAVISGTTGHVFVHEAGSIEATGHKVFAVPTPDGKLTPEQILSVLEQHTDEHMVKPRLVYLSNSTELGTLYHRQELEAISNVCRQYHLLLYIDGARLGAALTGRGNDLTLSEIARFADVFYIGGTKNGALMGEALVFCQAELDRDFRYLMKQRGAMLAKGWVLGLQFSALFQDGLYFDLAQHANSMAGRLQDGLKQLGFTFLHDSPTNQIFPIIPKEKQAAFSALCSHEVWNASANVFRLVTSWATTIETVDGFLSALSHI